MGEELEIHNVVVPGHESVRVPGFASTASQAPLNETTWTGLFRSEAIISDITDLQPQNWAPMDLERTPHGDIEFQGYERRYLLGPGTPLPEYTYAVFIVRQQVDPSKDAPENLENSPVSIHADTVPLTSNDHITATLSRRDQWAIQHVAVLTRQFEQQFQKQRQQVQNGPISLEPSSIEFNHPTAATLFWRDHDNGECDCSRVSQCPGKREVA